MRQRKYFVDNGLRKSAVSRANPRDMLERQRIRAKELMAIHGTIELRSVNVMDRIKPSVM